MIIHCSFFSVLHQLISIFLSFSFDITFGPISHELRNKHLESYKRIHLNFDYCFDLNLTIIAFIDKKNTSTKSLLWRIKYQLQTKYQKSNSLFWDQNGININEITKILLCFVFIFISFWNKLHFSFYKISFNFSYCN